jgi:hypothetical protein
MHDLRYGESLKQKVMPVQDGAPGDLGVRQAAAEGTDKLIEEQGYAVIDLRFCGRGDRPNGDLRSAPPDDLVAVDSNEFMKHGILPTASDRIRAMETRMFTTAQLRSAMLERILERAGVSVEALEQEMAEPQRPIPESVDVPWSSESKRVLHSTRLRKRSVRRGDCSRTTSWRTTTSVPSTSLLGLLRETDAAAAAVLGRHGVTIDLARDEVLGQSRSRSVSE